MATPDLPKFFWEDPEIKIDVYRACPEHLKRLDDDLNCPLGHHCKRWRIFPRRTYGKETFHKFKL